MRRAGYHRLARRARFSSELAIRAALLLACLLAPVLGAPARAAESELAITKHTTVTLVSDVDAFSPHQPFRLGLRFLLAPGWHIYWVNPGDAGTAPELTLTLPDGVQASGIAWPTPSRLRDGQGMSYGYTGEVVLPITVTPAGDAPVAVEAPASWLVCEKICVPEAGIFRLTIPPGDGAPSSQAPLFAAAEARMPRPSPFQATIAPDGRLTVSGEGLSAATVQDAWFFPAAVDAFDPDARQALEVRDGGLTLALRPGPDFRPDAAVAGVLVLRDPKGQESFLEVTAAPGPAEVGPGALGLTLAWTLVFAFLGGLVLNLMPCVFPILAMKALSIARLSGTARGLVRGQALAYGAGVIVTFIVFGFVLIALRRAGAAAGWGFQFQSPVFVACMAWLLFVVGLNLSGVFEIGGRFAGVGQALAARPGHVGSFFTGLLAVVVATPCTAPFMGAALAATVAAPDGLTIGVFTLLGLGLAAPSLVLAALPGLVGLLPRPGVWMVVLKQALAFPMYAACMWLVWVANQQSGADGLLAVSAGLVLVGFSAWAFGLARRGTGVWSRIAVALAVVSGLGALAMLPGIDRAEAPAPGRAADALPGEEPFSAARLAALRAEGRPVFVDMTAAWCVTCLVNERVALAPQPVREAFAARGVVYMKGDWTRQDPEITSFLRQHGRDGVPLYVFYPPNRAPSVLPQLLTEGTVLDELKQLGG